MKSQTVFSYLFLFIALVFFLNLKYSVNASTFFSAAMLFGGTVSFLIYIALNSKAS